MERVEVVQSIEKPENMSIEDELAWALTRIMNWPNPNGTIMDAYIPRWLAEAGKAAIRRYVRS